MKASKLYEELCRQGNCYSSEYASIDNYIDMLRDVCDENCSIENMMVEVGLHSLKKHLKKICKG